jgi:hypothetical protein
VPAVWTRSIVAEDHVAEKMKKRGCGSGGSNSVVVVVVEAWWYGILVRRRRENVASKIGDSHLRLVRDG